MDEIQLQRKHSCFKGGKLTFKAHKILLIFFRNHLIAFKYLFIFHNQIMVQKRLNDSFISVITMYLVHFFMH